MFLQGYNLENVDTRSPSSPQSSVLRTQPTITPQIQASGLKHPSTVSTRDSITGVPQWEEIANAALGVSTVTDPDISEPRVDSVVPEVVEESGPVTYNEGEEEEGGLDDEEMDELAYEGDPLLNSDYEDGKACLLYTLFVCISPLLKTMY